MLFLDCPAYLDDERTVRCGLPAEVRYRFTMQPTGGPVESAVIRYAAGHWFGPSNPSPCPAGTRVIGALPQSLLASAVTISGAVMIARTAIGTAARARKG
jgi:hypothetical protein